MSKVHCSTLILSNYLQKFAKNEHTIMKKGPKLDKKFYQNIRAKTKIWKTKGQDTQLAETG